VRIMVILQKIEAHPPRRVGFHGLLLRELVVESRKSGGTTTG
jgi:hypothetical protein